MSINQFLCLFLVFGLFWSCEKEALTPLDIANLSEDEEYMILSDSLILGDQRLFNQMEINDTIITMASTTVSEYGIETGSIILMDEEGVKFLVEVLKIESQGGTVSLTVTDAAIMSMFERTNFSLDYELNLNNTSRSECDFEDTEELLDDCTIESCVKIDGFANPRIDFHHDLFATPPELGIQAGFDIELDGTISLSCSSLNATDRRKIELASKQRLIKVLKKVKKIKVFQKKFPKSAKTVNKILDFLDDLPDIALGVYLQDFAWEGQVDMTLPLAGTLRYEMLMQALPPVPVASWDFTPNTDEFNPEYEIDCGGHGKVGFYVELQFKIPSIKDLVLDTPKEKKKKVKMLEMEGRLFLDLVATPRRDFQSGLRVTADVGGGFTDVIYLKNLMSSDVFDVAKFFHDELEETYGVSEGNDFHFFRLGTDNIDLDCGELGLIDRIVPNADGTFQYLFRITTTEVDEGSFTLRINGKFLNRFDYFVENEVTIDALPRTLAVVHSGKPKCQYFLERTNDCFVDPRDGELYCIVKYAGKDWFDANLRYQGPTGDMGVWLENEEGNSHYGRYYTFREIQENQLCPPGFHVPTRAEWESLIDALGGIMLAGARMKSSTTWNQVNSWSRFNALANGLHTSWDGQFLDQGEAANFWTFTMPEQFVHSAYTLTLDESSETRFHYDVKAFGHACRCVRDN